MYRYSKKDGQNVFFPLQTSRNHGRLIGISLLFRSGLQRLFFERETRSFVIALNLKITTRLFAIFAVKWRVLIFYFFSTFRSDNLDEKSGINKVVPIG